MSETQIYLGSPGASLEEMVPLRHVSFDGFSLLGDAAGRASVSFAEIGRAFGTWTVEFEDMQMGAALHRAFFGGRQPKRWRKAFDRAHKRIRKRERADFRTMQRRAIGITRQEVDDHAAGS